jgi:signal transduction histidine kinase
VASVSHELRTPLTGIQGYAQLLLHTDEMLSTEERRDMVETINVQAAHLGRIVTDLIDVARDRLQNVKLSLGDYSASELVREAIAASAGTRPVDHQLEDGVRVWADADRVRQVLVNLITNAIRYGRSKVTVVTRRIGPSIAFAVHDDGPGVPAKFQHDIFERFERGAHKFNNAVAGSGIGLSVGRDLVTAHGGTLRYRASEILGGACFEFTIPVPADSPAELVNTPR